MSQRVHLGSTSINADVEVDIRLVLNDLERDELRAYMNERFGDDDRDVREEAETFAAEMEGLLAAGRIEEALLLVQRWRRPKFETHAACKQALAKLRAEHPQALA